MYPHETHVQHRLTYFVPSIVREPALVRSSSRLHIYPFALLVALRNLLAHLLLGERLVVLEELGRPPRVVLALHEAQRGEVVADRRLLSPQAVAQAPAERDERGAHHAVRDDLVVVGLEQEENDTRCEDKVPLLEKEG